MTPVTSSYAMASIPFGWSPVISMPTKDQIHDTRRTSSAANVALLAPVPLEHLLEGQRTVESQGKVAFGSRAWETFRELDFQRKGWPVDVYIYASHTEGLIESVAAWYGRYIGHVDSIVGAHPDGMQYRPQSTLKYPNDNTGHWAVFWELDLLKPVGEKERLNLGDVTGFGKRKAYGHSFVPEGPLLIEHP